MSPSGRVIAGFLFAALAGCSARGFAPEVVAGPPLSLRWNPFPTPDYESLRGRIRDVRYDLRIWRVGAERRGNWLPGGLAYERDALAEAGHEIQGALPRDTNHVWAVRARFTLDGEPRATPWSTQKGWSRTADLPEQGFARLSTTRPWIPAFLR